MADSPSELHSEIETLERKHAEHPEGRFFVPLANAYRKLGDLETAEALLREGLRRHPDYLSAHIVLGRTLADQGASHEAAREFRYVLSLDAQNLIALRTLGELALAEGRGEEAARWYEDLLAVDPMNEEARQALTSLRGTPAPQPAEDEFRPGAGWWERPDEPEEPEQVGVEPVPGEPGQDVEPGALEFDQGLDPFFSVPGEDAEEDSVLSPSAPEAGTDAGYSAAEPDAFGGFIDLDDGFTDVRLDEPGEEPEALLEEESEDLDLMFAGEEDDPGDAAVVTETIAELYTRQGFHDRAAEVYRELIRRRGGDPALERRLAEVEQLAAAEGSPTSVAEDEPRAADVEPEDAEREWIAPDAEVSTPEDAFAGSFDGFAEPEEEPLLREEPTTPELAAASQAGDVHAEAPRAEELQEEEPRAEEPQGAPASTGASISQFLSELVAWSPAASAAPAEPRGAAGAEAEPDVAGWGAEPRQDEPPVEWGGGGEEPGFLELSGETVGDEPDFLDRGTGSADEEPFPWELPEDIAEQPSFETPAEPAQREELASYESFFLEDAAPPPAAEPVEPVEAKGPEPEEPTSAAEQEDDLESFQAWLRSLKR